uniref:Ig-like domain-containing protein n=1 Tax=Glossina pallidipes TaxID=7398 RepID=A0A1A9ZLM4_GLOPL
MFSSFVPLEDIGNGWHVSWVRHRDIHLLTVGRYTYTSDQRFEAMHSPHAEDWTLRIRYAQRKDSGTYECQISTTPPIGHSVYLNIVAWLTLSSMPTEEHLRKSVDVSSVPREDNENVCTELGDASSSSTLAAVTIVEQNPHLMSAAEVKYMSDTKEETHFATDGEPEEQQASDAHLQQM